MLTVEYIKKLYSNYYFPIRGISDNIFWCELVKENPNNFDLGNITDTISEIDNTTPADDRSEQVKSKSINHDI